MTTEPMPGDWAIFRVSAYDHYRGEVAQITKVTPTLVKLERTSWPRQAKLLDLLGTAPTREQAERIRDGLAGIGGEFNRRRQAADEERSRRVTAAREAAAESVQRLITSVVAPTLSSEPSS